MQLAASPLPGVVKASSLDSEVQGKVDECSLLSTQKWLALLRTSEKYINYITVMVRNLLKKLNLAVYFFNL